MFERETSSCWQKVANGAKKTIAAARAGIRKVILPKRNKRDLEDIPQSARALLEFVWVEHVSEALAVGCAAIWKRSPI